MGKLSRSKNSATNDGHNGKDGEDPLFAYGDAWPSVSARERDKSSKGRTPWEIKEREKDCKLRFDMPGMTKNDVRVWVEEGMLVVKAEKNHKKEQEGNVVVKEEEEEEDWPAESYGKYSSRIALPENIDLDMIKEEARDGVLYITIPKTSSSKIIDIDVQ